MKKQQYFLWIGLLVFMISACATTQPSVAPPGNPEKLVAQLETDLADARSNQVDILAPGFFKDAESSFVKAQRALEGGAKLSAISQHVAEGNASLAKAEEIAQVSRTILADTNKAREKALAVNADQLGEPYREVNEQYLKLTRAIENDNLSYAQENAPAVEAAFRDVEIMAIKHNALGNARQMMDEAERARLQKIAPTAHNEAQQALNDAEAYIEKNPYEAQTIAEKAAHAEFMVQRMIAVSESSKKFEEMSPEASALYLEDLLARLSQASDAGDIRDQGVENQISTLSGSAQTMQQKQEALESQKQAYQSQVADLEKQLAGLKGYSQEQAAAKERLAAEREFNERFNQVQAYFGRDEAEVYKQGNQLVIRLRGIQFPVGQSTLSPDNYTLLSKVQKAIQTFDQPTVTIEGHTDSTGSPEKNQELSEKRAAAVKTYLVANKTLPEHRIRSAGYGPDRPLAPNTTAEGRAINRRIDVLVTPSKMP